MLSLPLHPAWPSFLPCQTQSLWSLIPAGSALAQPRVPACLCLTLKLASCHLNFSYPWICDFQFMPPDWLSCSPYLSPSKVVQTLNSASSPDCSLLMLNMVWRTAKTSLPWRKRRTKSVIFEIWKTPSTLTQRSIFLTSSNRHPKSPRWVGLTWTGRPTQHPHHTFSLVTYKVGLCWYMYSSVRAEYERLVLRGTMSIPNHLLHPWEISRMSTATQKKCV